MGAEVGAERLPTGPRAAIGLIRSRQFGPYFVGSATSASGTWFQNLAAQLLVYRLTHSPFLLGVLNFCNFIPVLALAPWAGSAADRFDRRRLLLQLEVEESQRGRIMALWSVAFLGFRPVANLVDGSIAGSFGVRLAGVCLALPALLMAAVVALRA